VAEDLTIETLVKICGLTRSEDVALAVELGAWAVGFVFAPSPRRVTADAARRLVLVARQAAARRGLGDEPAPGGYGRGPLAHGPLAVGVFGDSPAGAIVEMVDAVGLDAVQLHGSQPDAAAVRGALAGRGLPVLVIRAVPVSAAEAGVADLRKVVAAARDGADLILFDTTAEGRWGGTGRTFPWGLAREAAGDPPYLVAGGIGPHNVREALDASGAWGVDVSSGVEQSPGIKDEALLRALFALLTGVGAGVAGVPAGVARPAENQERQEGTTI
jgi:phosphoribosylanthranilate isomerase